MKNCLTEMNKTMIILSAGKTEAGSAEVQPVRDSRAKATDGRRDDGVMPVIPSSQIPSRAFLCLKKPPRRRRGKELIVKGVCPFHAEPLQYADMVLIAVIKLLFFHESLAGSKNAHRAEK